MSFDTALDRDFAVEEQGVNKRAKEAVNKTVGWIKFCAITIIVTYSLGIVAMLLGGGALASSINSAAAETSGAIGGMAGIAIAVAVMVADVVAFALLLQYANSLKAGLDTNDPYELMAAARKQGLAFMVITILTVVNILIGLLPLIQ